jgi:hypothetical protein
LTFLLSAPAIRRKRLPGKLVGGDHEYAVRLGVWNIDDPQVSARCCLAQSNPRTFAAGAILTGFLQDFNDFLLGHFMVMNMGCTGRRVDIESGVQSSSSLILTPNCRRTLAWRRGATPAPTLVPQPPPDTTTISSPVLRCSNCTWIMRWDGLKRDCGHEWTGWLAAGMRAFVPIAFSAALLSAQTRIPSPDKTLYAVQEKGQRIGQGEERERVSVFTSAGKLVSVLHIWLTESDGTFRVGIRGCESSGWIDSSRFFCEGSLNPSTGVYRWFDARTGKELGEALGTQFTWSPDYTELACFGNVPHFSDVDAKSDSLNVGAHTWPPESPPDPEQHWFRSDLSWSPDGKSVAIVDHQRRIRKAFFLEILDSKTGKRTEHRLQWPDEVDDGYPDHDFNIEWTASQVAVRHDGTVRTFGR